MQAPAQLDTPLCLTRSLAETRAARQALFFGVPLRVLKEDLGLLAAELDYREHEDHRCLYSKACAGRLQAVEIATVSLYCHKTFERPSLPDKECLLQEQSLTCALNATPCTGSYACGNASWSGASGSRFTALARSCGGHQCSRELSILGSGHSSGSRSLEVEALTRRARRHAGRFCLHGGQPACALRPVHSQSQNNRR
jgi:hypothetical protein